MISAMEVRKLWLRMMGLDKAEIDEQCRYLPPTNLADELADYNAMCDIQEMNNG